MIDMVRFGRVTLSCKELIDPMNGDVMHTGRMLRYPESRLSFGDSRSSLFAANALNLSSDRKDWWQLQAGHLHRSLMTYMYALHTTASTCRMVQRHSSQNYSTKENDVSEVSQN